ncbi:hypothetical protein Tco_0958990, partial [Tanacetum coccineum]
METERIQSMTYSGLDKWSRMTGIDVCVMVDQRSRKKMDTDCMPLNPSENLLASRMRRTPFDKFFESLNDITVIGMVKDQRLQGYTNCSSREKFEKMDEVASVKSDTQFRNAPRDVKSNYEAHCVPGTLTHIQAKEADIEAIAELTCALDKK